MRVCVLEHPRIRSQKRFNDIANTPLWSCLMGGYAAATLQQDGHEVTFWDTTRSRWDFPQTKTEILSLQPKLLCINAVYIWEHTPSLFAFLQDLREEGFTGHINLFGFFSTLAWQAILQESPVIDSIAVGEYEETLRLLAVHLTINKELSAIEGLSLSSAKAIDFPIHRPSPRDPDSFPLPLRHLQHDETISILASRGCYNHCSFCPVPSFYHDGPLWIGRDPKKVIAEISELVAQGFRDFYFVDPNFIGPGKKGRERTMQLLDLLSPLGISFGMETRPNDLDKEILTRLVDAGLNSLLLGIESGSPEVLGNLAKGSSLSVSERAIELCRAAGIEPEIGFLMFVPDSTVADLHHNLSFLQKNGLLDRLDRTANLLSHSQIVLLGTSGYRRFKEQGRLKATGMFGFEGEVDFHDKGVKWISELVVYACHIVLREMEKEDSPIHWQLSQVSAVHRAINAHLVNLFSELLQFTSESKSLQQANFMKKNISKEIQQLIYG